MSFKRDDLSSVFIFVYKDENLIPAKIQRIYYDSYTKELVSTKVSKDAIKAISVDVPTEHSLREKVRSSGIFSINQIYYSHFRDVGPKTLFVVLDGKVCSVEWDVYDEITDRQVLPRELVSLIKAIQNMVGT